MIPMKCTLLYKQDGDINEEYNVHIVWLDKSNDGSFAVFATYGEKGKADTRVRPWKGEGQLGEANIRFDEVVREQVGKGYFVAGSPNFSVEGYAQDLALEQKQVNGMNTRKGLTQIPTSIDFF